MYDLSDKYIVVGCFDVNMYDKNIKTNKKIVVLTNERREHIIKRHPEVLPFLDKLEEILRLPDGVYKENKRKDTFWLVKNYGKNVKITLKLSIDNSNYENSIIQMQFMKNSKIDKSIKNQKISKLY